jgi:hypothetical protein
MKVSSSDITREFVCPGCDLFYSGDIYLCKSGHSICSVCYTKRSEIKCPADKECRGYAR